MSATVYDVASGGMELVPYHNSTNLNQAIGGYYQGLGAMQHHGPYDDTKQYIRNVRALMERL